MPDSKLPLFLSVTLALRAAATHSTCSWQIGPLQPTNYGFKHFCAASAEVDGEDKAYFKCDPGSAGYLEGIKIADWGILHPNLLELGESREGLLMRALTQYTRVIVQSYSLRCQWLRPRWPRYPALVHRPSLGRVHWRN